MTDKQVMLFLAVIGGLFVLMGVFSMPFIIYMEMNGKHVSAQLAGLIALPLGSGAAMIKGAFDKSKKITEEGAKKEGE